MKIFNDEPTSCGGNDNSQLLVQLHDFAMEERLTPSEVAGMYRNGVIQRMNGLNGTILLFAHGATREQARQIYASIIGACAQVA